MLSVAVTVASPCFW